MAWHGIAGWCCQGRMVAGANLDHDDTEDTCNNKGEYQQQQEEEEAAGGRRDRDKDRDRHRAAGGDAIGERTGITPPVLSCPLTLRHGAPAI